MAYGLPGRARLRCANGFPDSSPAADCLLKPLEATRWRERQPGARVFTETAHEISIASVSSPRLLARNGIVVLGAAISPYRQSREECTPPVSKPTMFALSEVFVRCPLETLVEAT